MVSDITICIPFLHSELAPENLPPQVRFIEPGLAAAKSGDSRGMTPPGLPYPPQEAAAVLRELLTFGAQFDKDMDLVFFSRARDKPAGRNEAGGPHIDHAELEDLQAFTAHGDKSAFAQAGQNSAAKAEASAKAADAHKTLLLAWNLEERLLEIRRLEDKLATAGHSLRESLGESFVALPGLDPDELADFPDLADLYKVAGPGDDDFMPGYGLPEISWRAVLEAAAFFFPEGSEFFVADQNMADTLRELTGLNSSSSEIRLPLWRLLDACGTAGVIGVPSNLKDQPWKKKEFVFLLPPGA